MSIEVARRGALVREWSTTTANGVDQQVPPNNGDVPEPLEPPESTARTLSTRGNGPGVRVLKVPQSHLL